jgi:D-sedoheptulose 7-phosphate isomerase
MNFSQTFSDLILDHQKLFSALASLRPDIIKAGELMINTIDQKGKILICGNGGSASDAQHFAAELVGRFEHDRRALSAIALTTDTSILTAVGNDYGYDSVFVRQVAGLGIRSDILIAISTSGNSTNINLAVEAAHQMGIRTVGLTGRKGGELSRLADVPIIIPHDVTARIQEAHIFVLHFWALMVENHIIG